MINSRRVSGISVLMLAAVLGGNAAVAQTLVQRQTMASEDAKLADEAKTTSSLCGVAITAAFDWKSFLAADKVEDMNGAFHNPPSNMCSVPVHEMQSMCQDALSKQAIAAKIKSFECVYQAGPTQSLLLDPAGKLQLRSSYEAYHDPLGDPGGFVKKWLGDHL